MSVVVSSVVVYPWPGGASITDNQGLSNIGELGWTRLRLSQDYAVDVPPNTEVETANGWHTPQLAVSLGLDLKVKVAPTLYTFKGQTLTQPNFKYLRAVSYVTLNTNDVRLDTTAGPTLGGTNTVVGGGVATRTLTSNSFPDSFTEIQAQVNTAIPTLARTAPSNTVGWTPSVTEVAPGAGNPGFFAKQFSEAEVASLRTIIGSGGGGGGGGAGPITSSFTNDYSAPIIPGTPVYSTGLGMVRPALGALAYKNVIGFYIGTTPLPPGGSGLFQLDGELQMTASLWDDLLGVPGGLIIGARYFLDFTVLGRIVRDPYIEGVPLNSYLVSIGYATKNDTLMIESQPGIRLT